MRWYHWLLTIAVVGLYFVAVIFIVAENRQQDSAVPVVPPPVHATLPTYPYVDLYKPVDTAKAVDSKPNPYLTSSESFVDIDAWFKAKYPPKDIPDTGGFYNSGGTWYNPSTGSVTAQWISGDGTWDGIVWAVNLYPNETKQCVVRITNTTLVAVNVRLEHSVSDIIVEASDVVVNANGTTDMTVSVKANGDAVPNIYNITLSLLVL